LIKGFESDQEEEDTASGEGYNEGGPIPKLPADALAMSKKQQKKLKKLDASSVAEEPGVVYIGRIPHGFFENEMKAYFTQFGKILRLRLSRNKRTGASKHFAFIEFESATVAEIVAKTMDSYLLFNHILKVKLVPAEQVHGDLFKGANKRFKKVPWNKLEGRKLGQAVSEEKWDQRVEREEQRRKERADKMKAIGYEFDAPKVKTTKQITRQEKPSLVLADEKDAEKPAAIEPAPAVETSSIPAKKGRKAKVVAKEAKPVESEPQEDVGSAPAAPSASKPEKGKKSKASKTAADGVESETADAPAKPKDKNKKVVEAVEAPAADAVIDVPEKKVKRKKSKAALTEESEGVSVEKAKKPKKSKN
jgi:nucleolar protein 15